MVKTITPIIETSKIKLEVIKRKQYFVYNTLPIDFMFVKIVNSSNQLKKFSSYFIFFNKSKHKLKLKKKSKTNSNAITIKGKK